MDVFNSALKNPVPPAVKKEESKSEGQDSLVRKKKNSRRKHRNSHLGCGTCKKRRIKCDENLPSCLNCLKGKLHCAYLNLDSNARNALRMAQYNQSIRQDKPDDDPTLSTSSSTNTTTAASGVNNHHHNHNNSSSASPTDGYATSQTFAMPYPVVQAAPGMNLPQQAHVVHSPYGPLVSLQPVPLSQPMTQSMAQHMGPTMVQTIGQPIPHFVGQPYPQLMQPQSQALPRGGQQIAHPMTLQYPQGSYMPTAGMPQSVSVVYSQHPLHSGVPVPQVANYKDNGGHRPAQNSAYPSGSFNPSTGHSPDQNFNVKLQANPQNSTGSPSSHSPIKNSPPGPSPVLPPLKNWSGDPGAKAHRTNQHQEANNADNVPKISKLLS